MDTQTDIPDEVMQAVVVDSLASSHRHGINTFGFLLGRCRCRIYLSQGPSGMWSVECGVVGFNVGLVYALDGGGSGFPSGWGCFE